MFHMITHIDPLKTFLPKTETKFVILGTMVAINARVIDGVEPSEPHFYYNNNRNHFWRVLQYLMNPRLKNNEHIKYLSIEQKKDFLNKNGIAICNLVEKIEVPHKYKADPSDTVLFEAYKKNRIEFKKVPPRVKKILKTKPLFFTCRQKKGIDQLVDGFLETNKLSPEIKEHIWYWPTPTRCNPYQRSLIWKDEMRSFLKAQKL